MVPAVRTVPVRITVPGNLDCASGKTSAAAAAAVAGESGTVGGGTASGSESDDDDDEDDDKAEVTALDSDFIIISTNNRVSC